METNQKNIFIDKLQTQKDELEMCQKKHNIKSCLPCEQLIGCPLRAIYVKTVYESMSKGETGGFEF